MLLVVAFSHQILGYFAMQQQITEIIIQENTNPKTFSAKDPTLTLITELCYDTSDDMTNNSNHVMDIFICITTGELGNQLVISFIKIQLIFQV